jgi:hypothetical protein
LIGEYLEGFLHGVDVIRANEDGSRLSIAGHDDTFMCA